MTRQCAGIGLGLLLACSAARFTANAQPAAPWSARAAASVAVIRGSTRVAGLESAVRVQRDRWGVAHIYAKNTHDLFFAQGFVVAQDRLFQMEMWKRSGQGRLAEVLGPDAVIRDLNARRLLYRGDLETEFRSYGADSRLILESFTAGINAYIDQLETAGGTALPVEFQLAGFKPERWQASDCLNRLAAYSMTGNAGSELLHAQIVNLLGADRANDLFDFEPSVKLEPAAGMDLSGLSPGLLKNLVGSDVRIRFDPNGLHESNDWTVAGKLTQSGKPLLANDPHRVIAEPSLRYVVHLVAPGWNVIGAGEPALPGVAAGHNEKIGWGFTIFGLDQQDLYVERLNPHNLLEYATPDGWTAMQTITERIGVRGAAAVDVVLKFTRHGPVLWEDKTRALAMRWVGAEPGTAGYLGSLSLDRARNWSEFLLAMPRWKVPSENIVYADTQGNIGEYSTGLAPLRHWSGLLPVPGDGGFEWHGFVPTAELPHAFNPAAAFIATANHKMIADDFPHAVGYEWADPVRFRRITQVFEAAIAAGHKLTREDMEALQSDVVSLRARELQDHLRGVLTRQPGIVDGSLRPTVDALLGWDGALRTDSVDAAVYEFWVRELQKELSDRIIPGTARDVFGKLPLRRVMRELAEPRPAVFGDDPRKGRDTLLVAALRAAGHDLSARLGPDTAQWTWGNLHHVTFQHSLDGTPATRELLDSGPLHRSGDGDVVQATSFRDDSFEQVAGASYREVFDLADWDHSAAINVPGQSGQPGAKHYADLIPLWLDGRYFPLVYSRRAVDLATTDVLTLTP